MFYKIFEDFEKIESGHLDLSRGHLLYRIRDPTVLRVCSDLTRGLRPRVIGVKIVGREGHEVLIVEPPVTPRKLCVAILIELLLASPIGYRNANEVTKVLCDKPKSLQAKTMQRRKRISRPVASSKTLGLPKEVLP